MKNERESFKHTLKSSLGTQNKQISCPDCSLLFYLFTVDLAAQQTTMTGNENKQKETYILHLFHFNAHRNCGLETSLKSG